MKRYLTCVAGTVSVATLSWLLTLADPSPPEPGPAPEPAKSEPLLPPLPAPPAQAHSGQLVGTLRVMSDKYLLWFVLDQGRAELVHDLRLPPALVAKAAGMAGKRVRVTSGGDGLSPWLNVEEVEEER